MPHAGYSDSVTNDGPGFHSNISGKSSPNPSLVPSRQVLYQRVTQADRTAWAAAERWVTLNLRMFSLINFAIEPPTLATARGRASLEGQQECLFSRHSLCPTLSRAKT